MWLNDPPRLDGLGGRPSTSEKEREEEEEEEEAYPDAYALKAATVLSLNTKGQSS